MESLFAILYFVTVRTKIREEILINIGVISNIVIRLCERERELIKLTIEYHKYSSMIPISEN